MLAIGCCCVRMWKTAFACAAACVGLLLGGASTPVDTPQQILDTKGTLTGTVEKCVRTPETIRLVVAARYWRPDSAERSMPVGFKTVCSLRGADPEVCNGADITVTGKLLSLVQDPDIPYQTDYNRYMFIDGVTSRMTVYNTDDYHVDKVPRTGLDAFINKVRVEWLHAVAYAGFNVPTTEFMLTVIGGDSFLLSDDMEEQFRQTGLSHLLAISGMHVSVVLMVLLVLFYPLKLFRRLRAAYFVAAGVFVVAYALITGGSPSACRAAAMCCLVLMNRMFEVRTNPLQTLAVAVMALLCIKPMWLFQPGFQLSVCAVLAIIAILPVIDRIPPQLKVKRWLAALTLIPIAAVVGTLVPTIAYFHSLTLNFWLANIVAAVCVPVLVVLGFVCVLLTFAGLSAGLLCNVTDYIFNAMTGAVDFISTLFPDSRLSVYPSALSLALLGVCAVLIGLTIARFSKSRMVMTGLTAVLCVVSLSLTAEQSFAETEIYIPRHFRQTDVIIAHKGRNLLWTSARDSINARVAVKDVATRYGEYFRRRGMDPTPTLIGDGFSCDGLSISGNVLTAGANRFVMLDEKGLPSAKIPGQHTYAIVTELYRGKVDKLLTCPAFDSLFVSASVNYSRHKSIMRRVDDSVSPCRSLREPGSHVWKFDGL